MNKIKLAAVVIVGCLMLIAEHNLRLSDSVIVLLVAMLVAYVFIFVVTVAWITYTKNDSKENIKNVANKVASILFWGTILLLIAVTIIYS